MNLNFKLNIIGAWLNELGSLPTITRYRNTNTPIHNILPTF